MGVKLPRKKKKLFLVRLMYLMDRLLPLSKKRKMNFYLDLEWIFDRFSHEYSFKNYPPDKHPVRTTTKDFLLRFIRPTDHLLDLGCNKGAMADYLSDHAKMVVGVDYDRPPIEEAKRTYNKPNLSFECVDAYEYLNSTHIKFDVLVLSHILEHLDNPGEFLARYVPFFKYVYIELPDFDKTLLNQYRLIQKRTLIYTDGDHISEFTREELQQLIRQANMEIIESDYRYGIQKLWCRVKEG